MKLLLKVVVTLLIISCTLLNVDAESAKLEKKIGPRRVRKTSRMAVKGGPNMAIFDIDGFRDGYDVYGFNKYREDAQGYSIQSDGSGHLDSTLIEEKLYLISLKEDKKRLKKDDIQREIKMKKQLAKEERLAVEKKIDELIMLQAEEQKKIDKAMVYLKWFDAELERIKEGRRLEIIEEQKSREFKAKEKIRLEKEAAIKAKQTLAEQQREEKRQKQMEKEKRIKEETQRKLDEEKRQRTLRKMTVQVRGKFNFLSNSIVDDFLEDFSDCLSRSTLGRIGGDKKELMVLESALSYYKKYEDSSVLAFNTEKYEMIEKQLFKNPDCFADNNIILVTLQDKQVEIELSCDKESYLENGKCSECKAVDFCISAKCSNSHNSVCLACEKGYFKMDGECVQRCLRGTYRERDNCFVCPAVDHCRFSLCTKDKDSVCEANSCKSTFHYDHESGMCFCDKKIINGKCQYDEEII